MSHDEEALPTTEERNPASEGLDLREGAAQVDVFLSDQAEAVEAVRRRSAEIDALVEDIVEALDSGGRLVYGGAGTSGRLGVLDASECPPTFSADPGQVVGLIAGGDVALRNPVEAAEDRPAEGAAAVAGIDLGARDVFLGITASGGTRWVLGALEEARGRGARTALLCCSPPPPDLELDHLLHLETGPEVITGSTRLKAGTATKVALNALTTLSFVRLGKVYGNLMVDVKASNEKLRRRARRIIAQATGAGPQRIEELLNAAGGQVKLAVLMEKGGVDATEAARALATARGHLRRALRTLEN